MVSSPKNKIDHKCTIKGLLSVQLKDFKSSVKNELLHSEWYGP